MKHLLFLFIILSLFGCDMPKTPRERRLESAEMEIDLQTSTMPHSTPLPIVGKRMHQAGFTVWELPHGWIVLRQRGYGAGLTFVPKPTE